MSSNRMRRISTKIYSKDTIKPQTACHKKKHLDSNKNGQQIGKSDDVELHKSS